MENNMVFAHGFLIYFIMGHLSGNHDIAALLKKKEDKIGQMTMEIMKKLKD